MKFSGQDKEELLELKQLLKEYRVLRTEQLYRWFSTKDRRVVGNMLSYLRRGGQLVSDPSGSLLDRGGGGGLLRAHPEINVLLALNEPELKKGLDEKRIAAFWVLAGFAGRVEYHACGEYPVQLFFFMAGEEYEIVYVPYGNEGMMGALFSQREQKGAHILVIVETPEQIETLEIPGADWFCTVAADGTIQRYLQEESE